MSTYSLRWISLLLMCMVVSSLSAAPPAISERPARDGQTWLTLSNGVLEVALNPQERGRVETLRNVPLNVSYLARAVDLVEQEVLLPTVKLHLPGGIEDWLWGSDNFTLVQPYEVKARSADAAAARVTLATQREVWALEKTVTLPADSVGLELQVTFRNTSAQPQNLEYWINSCTQIAMGRGGEEAAAGLTVDSSDWLQVPVTSKRGQFGKRGVAETPDTTLFAQPGPNNAWLAPAAPWLAKWDPQTRHTLALAADMEDLRPDGCFSVYFGRSLGRDTSTMEMLMGVRTVAPGASQSYHLRFLAIPECGRLLALGRDFAVSKSVGEGHRGELLIHALRTVGAFTSRLLDAGGAARDLGRCAGLSAGEHLSVAAASWAGATVLIMREAGGAPERLDLVYPEAY